MTLVSHTRGRERISVYAGAAIAEALAVGGGDNRSGRLNAVCRRYLDMVADELDRLDFSYAEWCAILESNKGIDILGNSPTMVWTNVHASSGLNGKWGIDQADLAGRLQRLPTSSLIALLEAIDRFWSRPEQPTNEALAGAGIAQLKGGPF
jgi:hypothetical protein